MYLSGHGINAYLQNKCHGFMDKRTYKDVKENKNNSNSIPKEAVSAIKCIP